jgi:hypothetical protein
LDPSRARDWTSGRRDATVVPQAGRTIGDGSGQRPSGGWLQALSALAGGRPTVRMVEGTSVSASLDVAAPPRTSRRSRSATGLRTVRLAATFVLLFGLCLAIALPSGGATQVDPLGARAGDTVSEVLPRLGSEDAFRYVGLGYDIAQHRGIPSSANRTLNLWPPGVSLFYAALFTVFGNDMPVGIVAGVTMAALWALLLTAFVDLLGRHLRGAAVVAFVAIVLMSDVQRDWILGQGLFWSEGLFTWCIGAALYGAMRSALAPSNQERLAWAAAIGAILGVSAYFRSVGDLLGWLMVGLLAVWAGLTLLRAGVARLRTRHGVETAPRRTWHRELLALALCVVAFEAVTVPWRIYAAQTVRPGNYSWTLQSANLWHDSWTPDRVFRERGLQRVWLLPGRPNTACHVDPDTCRRIAAYERKQLVPYVGWGRYTESEFRRLAIRALMEHPVAFGLDRLTFFRKAWFWKPVGTAPELIQNGALALAVIAGLWLSARRIRRSGPDVAALLYPGLLLASTAPLVFFHYESRYFGPMKLLAIVVVFVLIALDPTLAKALHLNRRTPPSDAPRDA